MKFDTSKYTDDELARTIGTLIYILFGHRGIYVMAREFQKMKPSGTIKEGLEEISKEVEGWPDYMKR